MVQNINFNVFVLGVCVAVVNSQNLVSFSKDDVDKIIQYQQKGYPGPFVRFLVAVNFTEGPCVATTITKTLQPHTKYNMTDAVRVGNCDQGPLEFDIVLGKTGIDKLSLIFYSSVIEDASPPTCDIIWNGSYLLPPTSDMSGNILPSLLPGCFVMDSREGYHMTYYWFYILDWGF